MLKKIGIRESKNQNLKMEFKNTSVVIQLKCGENKANWNNFSKKISGNFAINGVFLLLESFEILYVIIYLIELEQL